MSRLKVELKPPNPKLAFAARTTELIYFVEGWPDDQAAEF
jgi:hypothetical protein